MFILNNFILVSVNYCNNNNNKTDNNNNNNNK